MKIFAAFGATVLAQKSPKSPPGGTTTAGTMKPKSPTMTPHMTTTHMHGEDGYTDEYENMDDGYDHDNMDDYNDTSDHQNGHSDGEYGDEDGDYSHGDSKPMEGECSREAMKDWRHAMEKWQKSYKEWEHMMEHHKENGDMEGYKPDNDESGSGWFDWMGDWGMGGNNNDHNDDGDYYGGGSGDDYYGGSGDNMDYDDGSSFMDGFYEFLEFLGTEEFCQLLPFAVPEYLEPQMWKEQCLFQQKTQMAYNNLIGELMSGMITASEASHGICDLVAMEIENIHNYEPMFATYAGPILKHFQGSCECAVKNVIHFFTDDLSPLSALTCVAEIAQAVNEFDMYGMEYPDTEVFVNSTVPEWIYEQKLENFPNATFFMSWWFENDMQQQDFISNFPWSIEELSKNSGVNASDFAEALIASEQLAVLYSYKLKALGQEEIQDFEGAFYPDLLMKLGLEKTEYLLNADYSFDPMDFVDMSGSAAFAQAFGFDLEVVLGYLSMPYESFDMMKWNIISYYETYVNTMNSRFGNVAIPINKFEKATAEWLYYFSIDEVKEPGFAEMFIEMHKDDNDQYKPTTGYPSPSRDYDISDEIDSFP